MYIKLSGFRTLAEFVQDFDMHTQGVLKDYSMNKIKFFKEL